jgi:hypothetical protein
VPRFFLHLLLSVLLLISQQAGIAEVMAHPDLQFANHSNLCTQFEQDTNHDLPDALAVESDQFDDIEHLCLGFISKKFGMVVLLSPPEYALAASPFSYARLVQQGYQSRAPPLAN